MLKLFHAWGSCSLASLIALEDDGVDARQFPGIWDHHQRVGARPAVRRVLARGP